MVRDMTKNKDPVIGPGGYLEITSVDVVEDEPTSLSAAFSNGARFEAINLHDHLSDIDILEQVRDDAAIFSTAAIDDWGMLTWDNSAEMSADSLYRFYPSLLLFMTAMLGVVLSDSFMLLLLFWEMTSISSVLIAR